MRGSSLALRLEADAASFIGRDMSVLMPNGETLRGPIRSISRSGDILVVGLGWAAEAGPQTPDRWKEMDKKEPKDTISINNITEAHESDEGLVFAVSLPAKDVSWTYTIHASGDNLPRPSPRPQRRLIG